MMPLDDDELDNLLHQWRVPPVPKDLKRRVIPQASPWWQWILTGRIAVPAPVCLLAIAALIALAVAVIRDPVPSTGPALLDVSDFQPVTNLNPRIIRSTHETN